MTSEHASFQELSQKLLSRTDYHPFPKYEERAEWDKLPEFIRKHFLDSIEEILNFNFETIKATDYLSCYRTFSAPEYDRKNGARRNTLFKAVMAECIEGKGRLIDLIIDLIWAICEETTWIGPRHNNHMHDHMLSGIMKNALYDITDYRFVDLFTADTGSLLAYTEYFLKSELDKVSPLICKRIELELAKRIVIPFMHHDDMTWCGFYGHKINNWNPWIISNMLPVALITVKDPDLRIEFIGRCMEKLDIYTNQCPADGGCDEGPGYWGAAGGALFDCLEEFYNMTDGKLNFFENNELIKNIGEYIAKANVRGHEFVNFADNGHKLCPDPIRLYRFGSFTKSDRLLAFANMLFDEKDMGLDGYGHTFCQLKDLFTVREFENAPQKEYIAQDDFLPDTQILYIRDNKNQLTAAAKGGFNNESHNHNDLGHFICSYEGEQFLVDLGSLPYTTKTFSPLRYEIWILQSAYHNCAAINGFDQHDGDNYKAAFVSASLDEKQGSYSIELKGAYEEAAGIESYVRSFAMDKVNSVWTVTDHVELKEEGKDVDFHFVTVSEPKLCGDHFEITLKNGHVAAIAFDAENYDFSFDAHDLENAGLKKGWGSESAYRVHLTPKAAGKVFDSFIKVTVK